MKKYRKQFYLSELLDFFTCSDNNKVELSRVETRLPPGMDSSI